MNLCSSGATSSLKSASEYWYTKPKATNNIVGKVMGVKPSYRIIRSEDISFLYEAQTEILTILNPFIFSWPVPFDGKDSIVLKNANLQDLDRYDVNESLHGTIHEIDKGIISPDIDLISSSKEIENLDVGISEIITGDNTTYGFMNNVRLLKNGIPKIDNITNAYNNVKGLQELKIYTANTFNYGSSLCVNTKTIDAHKNVHGITTNGTWDVTDVPAEEKQSEVYWYDLLYSEYINTYISKYIGTLVVDGDKRISSNTESKEVATDIHILKSVDDTYINTQLETDVLYATGFDHIDDLKCMAILRIVTTTNINYSVYQNKNPQESSEYGTDVVYIAAPIKMNIDTNKITNAICLVPDYKDTKTLVNSIRSNAIPSPFRNKEIGKDIPEPNLEDVIDINDNSEGGTFTNYKSWTIDYKIYIDRIISILKPKYRTTFQ